MPPAGPGGASTASATPATQPGALDARYEELVRARFESLLERNPVWATFLGRHEGDRRLGSRSREAVEAELAAAHGFVRDLEALAPSGLSAATCFERELALQATRRGLFDDEVHRLWARKASAIDEIGDGLFGLFVRDFAPLPERLTAITARLEDAPRVLREQPELLVERPVRRWHEQALQTAGEMAGLFAEIAAAAIGAWGATDPRQAHLERAIAGANAAIEDHARWLRGRLADADDSFALGRERFDELVRLRAFDGLTTDDILEIGQQQLAENKAARAQAARAVDPEACEAEVVERLKADHPATFAEALESYREVMFRARRHIIERDLATIPAGETLLVTATPDFLRNVLPFAAYFEPPPFDPRPTGVYLVTASVDGDPRAMREHNRSAISNTSLHEAYPGHHLQLTAALTHPSLTRRLVDAPELVEGWGMYSEQMMREEGFDAEPRFLVGLATDAIWRACRIILDIRLHRGEIGVDEAIDWMAGQTGFERPNVVAEVGRYTYTPTYQFSYLLGKVLLLRLREAERRRLGPGFSLKRFHDALLYAGSLPISFQRRLLLGEGEGPAVPRPLPGVAAAG